MAYDSIVTSLKVLLDNPQTVAAYSHLWILDWYYKSIIKDQWTFSSRLAETLLKFASKMAV